MRNSDLNVVGKPLKREWIMESILPTGSLGPGGQNVALCTNCFLT